MTLGVILGVGVGFAVLDGVGVGLLVFDGVGVDFWLFDGVTVALGVRDGVNVGLGVLDGVGGGLIGHGVPKATSLSTLHVLILKASGIIIYSTLAAIKHPLATECKGSEACLTILIGSGKLFSSSF